MNYVDFRNLAEGDENLFITEDDLMFEVSETADGTQAIRRQRLDGSSEQKLATSMKMLRIYDELNRVLAGRVDFNHMISKVSESFQRKVLNDIYALWINATTPGAAGGAPMGSAVYFPAAGNWNEDTMLTLIEHVEAASGESATIVGTKKALRNAKEGIQSDGAKEELHAMGLNTKL